jgi:hypothetical protein
MVVEGSIEVGDETLQHRDAIGIWNITSINMSIAKNSRVLIVEVPMI